MQEDIHMEYNVSTLCSVLIYQMHDIHGVKRPHLKQLKEFKASFLVDF